VAILHLQRIDLMQLEEEKERKEAEYNGLAAFRRIVTVVAAPGLIG